MPSATELPKKISENDTPTTPRIPRRRIACGACSREDPHPKFALDEHAATRPRRRSFDGMDGPAAANCCAIVLEQVLLEAVERDRRRNRAGMIRSVSMLSPRTGSAVPSTARDPLNRHRPSPARRRPRPATAAAATIAGLISSVRPDRTALPSLEVAVRRRSADLAPSSLSVFIARHIEHPAPRHSNPASRTPGRRPSRSAASRTRLRPRHHQRPHVRRHVAAADDAARLRGGRRAARWCRSRQTRRRSSSPRSGRPHGTP